MRYAPSTKFYQEDRIAGKPWATRLPFPIQVLEKVTTIDRISRNRFVSRYAYHHGYYDGVEREFRGFGMVEQWDTEELTAFNASVEIDDDPSNWQAASHVPPILKKTWFHTGAYFEKEQMEAHFQKEYFIEPYLSSQKASYLRLPDTVLPVSEDPLTLGEKRQACRALRGSMLREEVYALDGTAAEGIPYQVLLASVVHKWLHAKYKEVG